MVRFLVFAVGLAALYYGLHSMGIIKWPTKTVGQLQIPSGVANAQLVQKQAYTAQWQVTNGDLHLNNQSWSNNSNVTILSANLECDQYNGSGADQAQQQITLSASNGSPLPPQNTETFGDLDIGKAVQGLSKVNCGINGVTLQQSNQGQPAGTNTVGTLPTQATGVAQQQSFTATWAVTNGDLTLNNGNWNNSSNVAVESVYMECDQYDGNNSDQAQKNITLYTANQTPLPAANTEQFGPIDMGQAVQNLASVKCGILSASTGQ